MRAHVAVQGEVFTDLVSMLPPHYLQGRRVTPVAAVP